MVGRPPKDPKPKQAMDPRLVALVVVAITAVFVAVALVAIVEDRHIDPELYGLMGLVAGGVLGYGVLKK